MRFWARITFPHPQIEVGAWSQTLTGVGSALESDAERDCPHPLKPKPPNPPMRVGPASSWMLAAVSGGALAPSAAAVAWGSLTQVYSPFWVAVSGLIGVDTRISTGDHEPDAERDGPHPLKPEPPNLPMRVSSASSWMLSVTFSRSRPLQLPASVTR